MRILFETIEEKEEYIEDNLEYDEDEDQDFYACPCCHSLYNSLEDATDCCPCSREEALSNKRKRSYSEEY